MATKFKVYDTKENKVIIESATAEEVMTTLDVSRSYIYTLAKEKRMHNNRYKVGYANKEPEQSFFDVYNADDAKIIKKRINAAEVSRLCNTADKNVYVACRAQSLVSRKYFIVKAGDPAPAPRKLTKEEELAERWEKLCEPFRNVEWVKTGGRKLEI